MRHAPTSTFTEATPFETPRAAAPVPHLRKIVAKVLWLLALPRRVAAIRRDMALLGHMSAGELADIGLMRQDLWDATSLPFGEAPGPLFTRRVAERRQAASSRRG